MPALTATLAGVLDAIARALLGDRDSCGDAHHVRIGTITLRPHQREALLRVRDAVAEFGGALLADEPGLGKTYVALALAREFPSTIVAAPAALCAMWREASTRAAVPVTFVSLETLSRRDVPVRAPFVIVDEAHHACNPAAARYARLARLAAGARVLLLTATPVRNRRAELDALLALFLGPRAAALDEATRARCVIRRGAEASVLPAIVGPIWHTAPEMVNVASDVADLPPPLPALDGREARALLAMTLARHWASSLAALDAALRRRLQRGAALDAVLEAGRVPTRAELRTWVVGDDAVQLAFPLLVAQVEPDAARMRARLRAHLEAVRALRERVLPHVPRDAAARAGLLARLAERHPGARIVAFTAFAATAHALHRTLRRTPGVAVLTGQGARTAGGPRPRADVLVALAAGPHHAAPGGVDDIRLVIATDLLSEGVNLQGASVIVHLDVPWTPAGLEQRVGRAVRIGSPHTRVHVHGFAPPPAAERLLTLGVRFVEKRSAQRAATHAARDLEQLRRCVAPWLRPPPVLGSPGVAFAEGPRPAFVAVMQDAGGASLVAGARDAAGRWHAGAEPRHLLDALAGALSGAPPDARALASARRVLRRFLERRRARTESGADLGARSFARRCVLERLDRILAHATPAMRAREHARLAALRAAVSTVAGAGMELVLAELARGAAHDDARWLETVERALGGPRGPPDAGAQATRPKVLALLLVTPAASSEP